jgi:para-aminobenzoate synthetase
MRTLLIDNYDSYTFNLFHLLGEVNGEAPLVVRNDELSWDRIEALDVDNIVISPGPGRPEHARDVGVSLDALRHATVPVLGVCLGHQALAYIAGGTVEHAREVMHGRLSPIQHDESALFDGIPQGFMAVRYHSLVVGTVPQDLTVTAWTPDGVVMALEHRARPLYGVQFHPESVATHHGRRLMENFRDLTPPRSRPPAAGRRSGNGREPARVLHHRPLNAWCEPETAFRALYADHPHAVWLDSASIGRFSYIGAPDGPLGHVVRYDMNTGAERVFDHLRRELARFQAHAPELPFDFQCGYAGYLGWELKAECGAEQAHRSPLPDAALVFCDRLLAFDHQERAVHFVTLTDDGWLEETAERLRTLAREPTPLPPEPPARGTLRFEPHDDAATYLANIEAAKREILEGETYEVCLTTELRSDGTLDPLTAYRTLRARNAAPFAAFLRLGDISVLSSSPERFLRVDRTRTVESRPMKGTAARLPEPIADSFAAAELRRDTKTRAENLMIADLVRNDLGRVCELGSVEVPGLMVVESHATVHQMITVVRGRLRPEADAIDCIRAAFPAGSMSGAPKLRTLEIIDRLEGRPRGVYSGALGFLSVNGTADLSIVIRTLVASPQGLSVGAGGAIVAGSDPEAELAEMRLKARALLEAVGGTLEAGRHLAAT